MSNVGETLPLPPSLNLNIGGGGGGAVPSQACMGELQYVQYSKLFNLASNFLLN